ncbi:MAG: hypothetical protein [Chaetfec virus UA24_144]|nr:MAG: hypothetical protein [Chaetfec virus UA24_144]
MNYQMPFPQNQTSMGGYSQRPFDYNPYGTMPQTPAMTSSASNPFTQQASSQPNYISGRIVKDQNEIMPSETPMNGSVTFFPVEDYSRIYAKSWDNNGTLMTVTYVPEKPVSEEKSNSDDASSATNEHLQKMNEQFEQLGKGLEPMNQKFEQMNDFFENVSAQLENIGSRLSKIEKELA